MVNVGNDEGDDVFWNEESGELEWWKVDEGWFHGDQAKCIDVLKSDKLENVDWRLGAERNG